jgi:hypothetical protein
MSNIIAQHWTGVVVVWVSVSVFVLLMRAWLLSRDEQAAVLPMQSRILVESSAVAVVADCLVFATLFEVLLALFGYTTLGYIVALVIAPAVTPLQRKFALRKFRDPAAG